MINYKGTRWYKCDLHLHTSASECFEDEAKSAEAFIDKVIKSGLECIAITDHNSAGSIDEIKKVASEKGITVFPGVEVTCTDAKVHILVIFDVDKTKQDVEDFLIGKLGLDRKYFGSTEAHIDKNAYEVIELAKKAGAIAIPAHIDEYSGLSLIAAQAKEKLFNSEMVSAVQIVHEKLLKPLSPQDRKDVLNYLKEYYEDNTLGEDTAKQWNSCTKYIKKIAKLTFSDNPLETNRKKHGLWGIGRFYSWIKMNEKPTLESLRQAFLVPKLRVKNCFESPDCPYSPPAMWIKNITIRNTTVTKEDVRFNFSPQLTTIIGGRGSGKSSILRFIRGVLKKDSNL